LSIFDLSIFDLQVAKTLEQQKLGEGIIAQNGSVYPLHPYICYIHISLAKHFYMIFTNVLENLITSSSFFTVY